jgi:ubiquinone/menaquinone biosynthesis C-methylase UbiE
MDSAAPINPAEYHLAELKRARSGDDPLFPKIPEGCRRVLDVGCGAGQSLIACDLKGARAFGIDFDRTALSLGKKQLNTPAEMACASGEALPFRDQSFDFLFSRVALPYMNIPIALAEFHRVLRPGGSIWLSLHPLSMLSWKSALTSVRRFPFEIYRLANTAALQFAGFQFRYPLRRTHMESYQTSVGIRRALANAGFDQIQTQEFAQGFTTQARKRPT